MPRPVIVNNHNFTRAYLMQWLEYDQNTGDFRWLKQASNTTYMGKVAGSKNKSGYVNIIFGKRCLKAHRLAWFFVTGKWPKFVDHINGVRNDNRWNNLRNVESAKQNQQNRKCHREGVLWGTWFHRSSGSYGARINVNGKIHSLGYYKTRHDAHVVAIAFARSKGISFIGEIK